jgi:uncharacterized protein (DUF2062 family)
MFKNKYPKSDFKKPLLRSMTVSTLPPGLAASLLLPQAASVLILAARQERHRRHQHTKQEKATQASKEALD